MGARRALGVSPNGSHLKVTCRLKLGLIYLFFLLEGMDLQVIWGLVSPAQISVSDLSLKFLHLGHMRQTVLCGTRFLPLPSCVPQTPEQLQQRDTEPPTLLSGKAVWSLASNDSKLGEGPAFSTDHLRSGQRTDLASSVLLFLYFQENHQELVHLIFS